MDETLASPLASSKTAGTGQSDVLPVDRTRAQTRAAYDGLSRFYDLLARRSEESIRRVGISALAPRPGERLLEVGFGTGHGLVDMAKAVGSGGTVHGLDLSEGMLKISRHRVQQQGLGDRVELLCGDAADMPYADHVMDGLFMGFTLELFDTPEIPRVLAECRRVLRPGGRLVVVGMSKEGRRRAIIEAFEWAHRYFPGLVDCRPIYIRRALEEAGFAIDLAGAGHGWLPVELVRGLAPAEQKAGSPGSDAESRSSS